MAETDHNILLYHMTVFQHAYISVKLKCFQQAAMCLYGTCGMVSLDQGGQ